MNKAPPNPSRRLPSLTPKELKVLRFLESYIRREGVAPTYSEIQNEFQFASINSVQNYLKQLSLKGYIHQEKDQKRGLKLLASSQSFLKQSESTTEENGFNTPFLKQKLRETPSVASSILQLPLLGRVAAGAPLEAILDQEFLEVSSNQLPGLSGGAQFFALQVKGESMKDEGILNGDYIILKRQETAHNGQMVVASIEGESTLKRVYTKSGQVELRPSNPQFKSQWYPSHLVEIKGLVVGLVRSYH